MDTAKRLLQVTESSEIARTARSGLIGWRAILADAVARCPQDPGRIPAIDLIGQVDEILRAWGAEQDSGAAATAPAPYLDFGLRDLVAAFAGDPSVVQFLDTQSLAALRRASEGPQDRADAIWRALHLCLLRLPEQVSAQWRGKTAALSAPAEIAAEAWRRLPGEHRATLVPVRATPEGTLLAGGIQTAPDAVVDEEVLAAVRGHGTGAQDRGDAAELARLSSLLLALTALDENLVLCLESVHFKGSTRLDDKIRQLYGTDLLGRLREYARSEPGSAASLEALIEVDEAVNSLTHRPPAAVGSWWDQIRQQSRRMVDQSVSALKARGTDVEVMQLSLRYRDVRDLTSGNDVASRSGGEPGDVLACLRLWARIGGKTVLGRVMYRVLPCGEEGGRRDQAASRRGRDRFRHLWHRLRLGCSQPGQLRNAEPQDIFLRRLGRGEGQLPEESFCYPARFRRTAAFLGVPSGSSNGRDA
jgi:hypothetical protein